MTFTSYDGEISFGEGDFIKIRKGKKGPERIISVDSILYVTLIKPAFIGSGCIHIQVVGGHVYSSVANISHYADDINAIAFYKKQYGEAAAFKDALDKFIISAKGANKKKTEDLAYLKELKILADEGVITQEEFEKKKASILG